MKVWIDAKGFPGYEVSNESDVRNKKTGRLLHQYESSSNGYIHLTLMQNKRPVSVRAHRLVADSFFD